jgi:hypothetical protein
VTDATSGAGAPATVPGADEVCPHCGRKKHDEGKYQRSRSERKKALKRDAADPNSGLSDRARQFIVDTDGEFTPPGHEVSHEEPLYTKPKGERCKIDKADNLKTQQRSKHRARHRRCGQQYHKFPR